MRIRPFHVTDRKFFNIPPFPPTARAWVISGNNEVVGYAALDPLPGLNWIGDLYGYVVPRHRRKGYGTLLLRHVIEQAAKQGIHELSTPCESPNSAVAFFLRHHNFYIEHVELELVLDISAESTATDLPELKIYPDSQAAPLLISMYERSFAGTAWHQPYSSESNLLDDLGIDSDMFFLEHEGTPVGFAGVRYEGKVGDIEPLGIVPEMQQRGLGRIMMKSLIATLQKRGFKQLQLAVWQANKPALALYQSLNFRQAHAHTFMGLNIRSKQSQKQSLIRES